MSCPFSSNVDEELDNFTHSPMINKKSIHILNNKFKREHKQAKEKVKKASKYDLDYNKILNGDIPKKCSPIKHEALSIASVENMKNKIKKNLGKSRNNPVMGSQSYEPKTLGRKDTKETYSSSSISMLYDNLPFASHSTYVSLTLWP